MEYMNHPASPGCQSSLGCLESPEGAASTFACTKLYPRYFPKPAAHSHYSAEISRGRGRSVSASIPVSKWAGHTACGEDTRTCEFKGQI